MQTYKVTFVRLGSGDVPTIPKGDIPSFSAENDRQAVSIGCEEALKHAFRMRDADGFQVKRGADTLCTYRLGPNGAGAELVSLG